MITSPKPVESRTRHIASANAVADALPPLLVGALRVAHTLEQGLHGRRRAGIGETFWQFRRYHPGDPPTAIDWRQTAKGSTVFVREREWEATQSVWLWADRSGSMDYRSSPDLPSKRDRAAILALALAALLSRAGERIAVLGGDAPPATGRASLEHLAFALEPPRDPATSTAPLPPPADLPRHAELVVIGDLLSPLDDWQDWIAAAASRGVTGYLVQVLDPAEEILPFDGRVRFEGLEGEDPLLVPRVDALRTAYHERLAAHRAALADLAGSVGWRFLSHRTDQAPQNVLLALHAAMAMPHQTER